MTRAHYLRGWKMPRNEYEAHPTMFVDTGGDVRISHPIPGFSDEDAEFYDTGRARNWAWVVFCVCVAAGAFALLFGAAR